MDVYANMVAPSDEPAPDELPTLSARAEEVGFDGLLISETTGSPFVHLTQMAQPTSSAELVSSITIAFPRSPTVLAYSAWHLQRLSGGRLVLGLGVSHDIKRRFSVEWSSPGPRMKDYIRAVQHLWDAWQSDSPVDYRGEFYTIDSCPDLFRPEPLDQPRVPIHLGGTNRYNVQTAGELTDGIMLTPIVSTTYVQDFLIPHLEKGAERGGRSLDDVQITAYILAITGRNSEEMEESRETIRSILSMYCSFPAYRPVLELHGWGALHDELHELAEQGRQEEMPRVLEDEHLRTLAVEAPWGDLREAVASRYPELDAICLYTPTYRGEPYWEEFF